MGEEKILVAGHLSLDRIKTPDREEDQVPGGAALYTSVAASVYGGTTGLLTTCCSDFPKEVLQRKVHRLNLKMIMYRISCLFMVFPKMK